MAKFILAFLVVLLQETATLTSLLFATHRGAYPALLIHVFFIIATVIDIVIGYAAGAYLKKKVPDSKITRFINNLSKKFSFHDSRYKRWFALFLLGNFSFPWINACIAGYMEFPFWESAVLNFLGDVLYYASLWAVAIGFSALFKNFYYGLIAAVVFALLIIIAVNIVKSKKYGIKK